MCFRTNCKSQRNCIGRFVVKDITDGLDEYEGMFDLVHSRSVAGHVSKEAHY